jgi:glycosyltransferase involved in cell wall biosynthesis
VCHPSLAEGFGIPCLEAMAFGAPVVAASIPSIRELGGDGVELVAPGDPEALAEALRRLLDDEESRRALARRGQARAGAFSWATMADRIVETYRTVVS